MAAALVPKSNLELDFATPKDARELSDVWYQFFPDPFIRRCFPLTPSVQQWWDDANTADMLNRPAAKYLKITDSTANDGKGKIVAFCKWLVPVQGQNPDLEDRYPPWAEESDKDLCDRLFGHLAIQRAKYLGGRQHYFLDALGTLPEYRRQGAASQLVGWGTSLADQDGVECYVEASDQGRPVYEKFGFEPLEPFVIPGETFQCTCYLRPARE